jgi:hypothetical protein
LVFDNALERHESRHHLGRRRLLDGRQRKDQPPLVLGRPEPFRPVPEPRGIWRSGRKVAGAEVTRRLPLSALDPRQEAGETFSGLEKSAIDAHGTQEKSQK